MRGSQVRVLFVAPIKKQGVDMVPRLFYFFVFQNEMLKWEQRLLKIFFSIHIFLTKM